MYWRAMLASMLILGTTSCQPSPNSTATPTEPGVAARPLPTREDPIQPISDECKKVVKLITDSGVMRPGDMTSDGAVMLVDARWTNIPFSDQAGSAECISHYMAGGQNRWIKKISFKNQRTGVVYGTIENTRYRSGP